MVIAEQHPAHLVGVFARRRCQLVEEALGHEGIVRASHGSPEPDGDAGVLLDVLNPEVGDLVGEIGRTLHRRPVDSAGKHPVGCENGRPHQPVHPRRGHPVGAEGCREPAGHGRPVVVVTNVVLPRPDHLDGSPDGLGDLHRLGEEVLLGAAPETAAEVGRVDEDGLRGKAREFRRRLLRRACACVGAQISQRPGCTWAVQFMGSIVAWAR